MDQPNIATLTSEEEVQHNREKISKYKKSKSPILFRESSQNTSSLFKGNIEKYVGMAQIPKGIVDPLKVIGKHANDEFIVPLCTTEGALVASYNRGAKVTKLSGGVKAICIKQGVQRSPLF